MAPADSDDSDGSSDNVRIVPIPKTRSSAREALEKPLSPASIPRIDPLASIVDVLDTYLASLDSAHTKRSYGRHLQHAFRLLGLTCLQDLQGGHLVAYRTYILADGRGVASHAQALISLRSFLAWAAGLDGHSLRMDQVREHLLRVPSVTVVTPYQVLAPAEIKRFLKSASNSSLRDLAIALVLLGSGVRVSELCHLDCSDLRPDVDGGTLLFVREGKGKKDRLVPIHDEVTQALHAYLSSTGRRIDLPEALFLGPTQDSLERIKPRAVGRIVRTLCTDSVIAKRISPHSLRHTFALACLRHCKDLLKVSKLLGHSAVSTTKRYVDHLDLVELRTAIPHFLTSDIPHPETHPLPL